MIQLHQIRLILPLTHVISVEIDYLMAQSMQVDIKIPVNLITHGYILNLKRECTVYCKLCKKFDIKNKQNQFRVWNTETCITIPKDMNYLPCIGFRAGIEGPELEDFDFDTAVSYSKAAHSHTLNLHY